MPPHPPRGPRTIGEEYDVNNPTPMKHTIAVTEKPYRPSLVLHPVPELGP